VWDAGRAQHHGYYYRVEHTLHWDALGAGFQSDNSPDAMNQCGAVLRPRTPDQGAVNVE